VTRESALPDLNDLVPRVGGLESPPCWQRQPSGRSPDEAERRRVWSLQHAIQNLTSELPPVFLQR
jgi:hypothetical protein